MGLCFVLNGSSLGFFVQLIYLCLQTIKLPLPLAQFHPPLSSQRFHLAQSSHTERTRES